MEKDIKTLIKIADYLEDASAKALLNKWNESLNSNRWFLPFIGRFSAGKSSLINALMHNHVLPTARIETTAAITTISYADSATASIAYRDGSVQTLDISNLKDLRHETLRSSETEISEISVAIPLETLKNGLVIIDSPGMDTIVNNHETLAQFLIGEALMTVYVINGAPSEFDFNILQQLIQLGVETVVVRTHMDTIKQEEESYVDVISNDEELILTKLGKKIPYFAVSTNDVEGILKDEFVRFEQFLNNTAVVKLQDAFQTILKNRIDKIKNDFKNRLIEKKSFLESNSNKTMDQIDSEIKSIEEALKSIEDSISSVKKKTAKEKSKVKENILDDITDYYQESATSFKKKSICFFD